MASPVYTFIRGDSPLLVSMPHVGTQLADEVRAAMVPEQANDLGDTDWHLRQLYDFATTMGASVLSANFSRYVIDLNRPPGGESLYPGQNSTGLCSPITFDGSPLYLPGHEPDDAEVQRRLAQYWQPYHACLKAQLDDIVRVHGYALLWDAHSIRSHVPRLFDGELPVLNFGTAGGASCDAEIAREIEAIAARSSLSMVFNGRFKGGYITRHYGNPAGRVHAMQLELAQRSYMQEVAPYAYDVARAANIKPLLRELLGAFAASRPA